MHFLDKTLLFYLNQINKVPLLTREEEFKLAVKARTGDQKAKQKLVSANLRFVVQMAKRYSNSNMGFLDLISEGNLGLIRAVETFDPNRGFHFISYAVHWIKQSIIKAISEKSKIVRIPLNLNNSLSHIEKAIRERHNGELNDRSLEEISKDMKMGKKEMLNLIEVTRTHSSLDKMMDEDSGSGNGKPFGDFLEDDKNAGPEDNVINDSLREDVRRLVSKLPTQESEVLVSRFGLDGKEPKTLLEIGKEKNLTKERIRQIEKKALEALKHPEVSQHLADYLND